jgi:hypothetical protein
MSGIDTLFPMEQQNKSFTQMLPCGQRLTISSDLDEAQRALDRGDIAVYDDRFTPDPSFRVFRSCEIRSKRLRRDVLCALIQYDAACPADPPWKRTLPSLEREWLMHNVAYRAGFLRSRAAEVDLDNHAEGKGALGYFLKSAWEVIRGFLKPKKSRQ